MNISWYGTERELIMWSGREDGGPESGGRVVKGVSKGGGLSQGGVHGLPQKQCQW